jgi:hypothetical protein
VNGPTSMGWSKAARAEAACSARVPRTHSIVLRPSHNRPGRRAAPRVALP